MSNWKANKAYSDQYLTALKRIVGEYLVGEAPHEEDAKHNTDLIVLKMDAVRIGCRVRRRKYLTMYPNEFTIRYSVPSGAQTELSKIMEGWGDYFLYGFGGDNGELLGWTLGDLNVFRRWMAQQLCLSPIGCHPGDVRENPDGTKLVAFRWDSLPPHFVRARSMPTTLAA